MKIKFAISLLLVLFLRVSVAENTGVQQLTNFIAQAHAFEADFSQSLFDEHGYEMQFSAGKFSLQKPGKFSWDYEEPYYQVIMSNGKLIWLFDSELEQVTIKPVDSTLTRTSMILLFDDTDILNKFNIVVLSEEEGISWLQLNPKTPDAEFNSVIVGMKTNQLVALKLIDGFGQTTFIKFTHIKQNPQFASDRFEFKIPKNADVIGN
jgi:outer membrane lipoprotein carrier protein